MKIEPIKTTAFEIHDAPKLDPIRVFIQDTGIGQGRLTIECFGRAWSAYWGSMSGDTVQAFITRVNADYIAHRMRPERSLKRDDAYLLRIVEAVQSALRTLNTIPSAPEKSR